jgi:hypothetical protein
MMNTVQLALADPVYAAAVRDALTRSGPWHVVTVERPDPRQKGVLVIDEDGLTHMPMPLPDPERVVLVTRKDPQHFSLAWDAGIVSVVSVDDPPNTVLLAIMAAALRVPKARAATVGGISPNAPGNLAPSSPEAPQPSTKRFKTQ